MTPEHLAALCERALPGERLTAGELAEVCFGAGDEVVGDESAAAAYRTVSAGGHVAAWLVLVAVDPDRQGRGIGKRLVAEVAERARAAGATDLHLGGAVPRYLWPGVDLHRTAAAAFFEGLGFADHGVAVNMEIPTAFRRDPPPGITVARDTGGAGVDLCRRAFPHWEDELRRSIDRGTAFTAFDDRGRAVGFSCHSANRFGWIGPMASDPELGHIGIGSATLAAVCNDLAERGVATGEIVWVSNLRFYGKCGATVGRVFRAGRLTL